MVISICSAELLAFGFHKAKPRYGDAHGTSIDASLSRKRQTHWNSNASHEFARLVLLFLPIGVLKELIACIFTKPRPVSFPVSLRNPIPSCPK